MILLAPSLGQFTDANGVAWTPDATGRLDIGANSPAPFLAAGFSIPPDTSAARPTVSTYPGMPWFDPALGSAGKPIWRNAANTGWIDATGTAV